MLIRLSGADALAVPLDVVKAALRVDFDDDDALLRDLIRGETRRYEEFTRRLIAPGEFELLLPGWRDPVVIPADPVREVISLEYLGADGMRHALATADWTVEDRPYGAAVRLRIAHRPALSDQWYPVRLAFRGGVEVPGAAGTGTGTDDPSMGIDAADRSAIIHMVKHQYDEDAVLTEAEMRARFSARRLLW